MDSLFVLTMPCPSLPIMQSLSIFVRQSVVVWWPCVGEGALRGSLYLSPNVLVDSPIYSSLQSSLWHLYQYITPLLYYIKSLSLGDASEVLIVCCHWNMSGWHTYLPFSYMGWSSSQHQWELPQHQQAHRTSFTLPGTPYIRADKNNFSRTWRSQSMCLVKACLDEVSNILFNKESQRT